MWKLPRRLKIWRCEYGLRRCTRGRASRGCGACCSEPRLISENILEPLALPATGGVLTAIFAFLFVVQGILVGVPVAGANDWPGNLIQPARLESLAPFPVAGIADSGETPDAGLLIVDATLNELGQVVSYNILAGPNDAAVRHQLDQVLLFSRFRPQISFGRPMPGGRVILNFSEVRVRG